jgi:hypothetical protein
VNQQCQKIDTWHITLINLERRSSWNIDPLPMVYQILSYGIMNSSLLVEMRGGSIYHEGVQITMTKKLTPGSKYHMEN